jgi:hypothetical protein
MDTSDSIGVYGEAKAEYTRQLCSFLVPALETYFLDSLADVKANEKDPKRFLWVFQDTLKQFPDWNIDKVQRETEKIVNATRCDYLEEILTAVFIAHTKVLSAIRLTSKQKKLQITIPKLEHFLHRTMSECARLLWSNAYLFSDSGPAVERQKNLRQVEQLLHEGVLQSIRGMLPVKSILKEYLSDEMDEPAQESVQETTQDAQEEETAPVVHEESVAPVVKEEVTEEKQQAAPSIELEPRIDLSGSEVVPQVAVETPKESPPAPAPTPASTPTTPTIIVDTEPPSVSFTHMDAVLDSENPNLSKIQMSNQMDEEDDEEEVTRLEFDMSEAPEALEDFEDLEKEDEEEAKGIEADEFETL